MREILVIPDPHDEPDVDKERFKWAGRYIADKQPDAIVCLGDMATFDSLSSYDKGTVYAEGKRYKNDVDSFAIALNELHAPVDELNEKLKKTKKKQYSPRWVYCEGNHELRVWKAVVQDPKLINTISIADLGLQERGWEYHSITEPVDVYGIAFAHYFTSGIYAKPISGLHHARTLVAKTYTNTVVGHSHTRQFWEDTNIYGKKIMGLVAGCYFEHDLNYTTEEDRAWVGLVNLRVEENEVDPEFINIERIKREYA